MHVRPLLLAVLLSYTLPAFGQGKLTDWVGLIDKHQCEAARHLCVQYETSHELAQQVEAEKCLANVELCGHDVIQLQGDDVGGGTMGGGFDQEAVDKALEHLRLGIQLAPQDASIHQGRLHILEVSTRYEEMVKALDESCNLYKGADAPDLWLAYSSELMELRQYKVGLAFMKVLEQHYPNNPDILGNIGAFLDLLKQDDEAISYLQRAVALAPKDPINTWDLARAYDYSGNVKQADSWYQKALTLTTNDAQKRDMSCLYGEFVEKKVKDLPRACKLESVGCAPEKRTACNSAK